MVLEIISFGIKESPLAQSLVKTRKEEEEIKMKEYNDSINSSLHLSSSSLSSSSTSVTHSSPLLLSTNSSPICNEQQHISLSELQSRRLKFNDHFDATSETLSANRFINDMVSLFFTDFIS
jgi:hypothetical protein